MLLSYLDTGSHVDYKQRLHVIYIQHITNSNITYYFDYFVAEYTVVIKLFKTNFNFLIRLVELSIFNKFKSYDLNLSAILFCFQRANLFS